MSAAHSSSVCTRQMGHKQAAKIRLSSCLARGREASRNMSCVVSGRDKDGGETSYATPSCLLSGQVQPTGQGAEGRLRGSMTVVPGGGV